MIDSRSVVVISDPSVSYPTAPPFRPGVNYPELRGKYRESNKVNKVFCLFREAMLKLGLDAERYSSKEWDPFSHFIKPGQSVLIKPNLVRHMHMKGGDYEAVVTHGSMVRCALEYAAIALDGKGEITVGDAPVQSADFDLILERSGLDEVCTEISRVWNIPVRLVDFRLWSVSLGNGHSIIDGMHLEGDRRGYTVVDLGKNSLLQPICHMNDKFKVTSYDCDELKVHHNEYRNEYLLPNTVLGADVVINMPKLKTHRKVGLTAALKNLVGINGHKDWLPHHRCGAVVEGGDEYERPSILKRTQASSFMRTSGNRNSTVNTLKKLIIRAQRRYIKHFGTDPYYEGSWHGNDTLWRTVLDLNRILLYADKNGDMQEVPQRECVTFVDAIVAGDGEGPMEPDTQRCGVIVAGRNSLAIDTVLAKMVGFDYRKIPLIERGYRIEDGRLASFLPSQIEVVSNDTDWDGLKIEESCKHLNFRPASGWKGFIELQ